MAPTLRKAGLEVDPLSLFMQFGKMAGWKLNDALSQVYPSMVGEWIWSKAAFGEVKSEAEYVKKFKSSLESICREAGCTLKDLRAIRNTTVFEFLDWAMETIDWPGPRPRPNLFLWLSRSVVSPTPSSTMIFRC